MRGDDAWTSREDAVVGAEWGVDSVVAHGLLNSMAVIHADAAVLATKGHLLGPEKVRELSGRIDAHAAIVTDALRDMSLGLPPDVRALLARTD